MRVRPAGRRAAAVARQRVGREAPPHRVRGLPRQRAHMDRGKERAEARVTARVTTRRCVCAAVAAPRQRRAVVQTASAHREAESPPAPSRSTQARAHAAPSHLCGAWSQPCRSSQGRDAVVLTVSLSVVHMTDMTEGSRVSAMWTCVGGCGWVGVASVFTRHRGTAAPWHRGTRGRSGGNAAAQRAWE